MLRKSEQVTSQCNVSFIYFSHFTFFSCVWRESTDKRSDFIFYGMLIKYFCSNLFLSPPKFLSFTYRSFFDNFRILFFLKLLTNSFQVFIEVNCFDSDIFHIR